MSNARNVKQKKTCVLLINSHREDFEYLQELLDNDHIHNISLSWVDSPNAALKSIKDKMFDVYLVDERIGKTTEGIDFLRKAHRKNPKLVAIFLSENGNPDLDLLAMKTGAVDYLVKKELSGSELERSIRYACRNKHTERILEKRVDIRTQELLELNESLLKEITRRKKIEKQLRENAQRLELAQKAGKIGMFDWDIATGKVTVSRDMETVCGYPSEYFSKGHETWIKIVHEEDRERVNHEMQLALSTGKDLITEYRIILPNNAVRYIACRAQVLKNKRGVPIRMIGINMDITDRKLIENAMAFLSEASTILNSSLHYETTLSTVASLTTPQFTDWCAIDMRDSHGSIQRIAVSHKDPEKIAWAKKFDLFTSVNSERSAVARVLKTGKSEFYPIITDDMLKQASRDAEHLKFLRSIHLSSVIIVPLIVNKNPVGAISFVLAESGRHFSVIDLAMAEDLAQRAALAIHNAQLYQNAEIGIKTRDEFLNIASHELKTPLTSLQLQLQILKKRTYAPSSLDSQALVKFLTVEENQLKRLTKLINNLLDVSRIHAQHLELECEEADLGAIVEEALNRFQEVFADANMDVHADIEKGIIGSWDTFKIDQVITNLLSNAIKYGKNNPITIRVFTQNGTACIEVSDKGIGMKDTELDKIFERFGRTESAKNYDGLGLGLYISNQFIQAHGGKIRVQSHPDAGSTFTVLLPVAN